MTITREQVADLQPGDVVEIAYDEYPEALTRGPLRRATDGRLWVADLAVVEKNGEPVWNGYLRLLTVVSRAPRALYVNHPRTEPVPGDVVRDADDPRRIGDMWMYVDGGRKRPWVTPGENHLAPDEMPARLRLLVDGETGDTVPAVQS